MDNERIKEFIAKLKGSIANVNTVAEECAIQTERTTMLQQNDNNKSEKELFQNCIKVLEKKRKGLREERERVCFPIINRGQVWYDTLTQTQRAELKTWYTAWLNSTRTLKAPTMPEWLQ